MDIIALEPSRIITVARAAMSRPDTDFLCFGESDQPFPQAAADALIAAINRGDALYSDVRGTAPLRHAIAGHLTTLHTLPVAETRIQVTSSGMTAVNVALAATVRAGDRVVLHGPAWPNPANAARLRGAHIDNLDLDRAPMTAASTSISTASTPCSTAPAPSFSTRPTTPPAGPQRRTNSSPSSRCVAATASG